ncbi:uncharacterized protein SPSK_08054 [Sporothrix schenckii 1099-18]|uniref:Uncharacterized protein n=1 Tax=Sporothrix schenckii 1099-18 TaxID=1397361 RepID=A0A0F2MJQ5_SPOSC|nr:uncharacterized protein SPSK_08054 [Sporothrix schenckii 1099-18]KJR88421.1 hypothetical protein SPSK_08054 [Sporothrix schenckii 1099-18]
MEYGMRVRAGDMRDKTSNDEDRWTKQDRGGIVAGGVECAPRRRLLLDGGRLDVGFCWAKILLHYVVRASPPFRHLPYENVDLFIGLAKAASVSGSPHSFDTAPRLTQASPIGIEAKRLQRSTECSQTPTVLCVVILLGLQLPPVVAASCVAVVGMDG